MKVRKVVKRLIDLIDGVEQDECILFKHRHNRDGYSQVRILDNNSVYAHRFSYCWANGLPHESISELCIMHSCDTPSCINPKHLSEGTWADNNKDRADKSRTVVSIVRRKLSKEDVIQIKIRYGLSKKRDAVNGVTALARDYAVDTNTVYKAIRGVYDDWTELRQC